MYLAKTFSMVINKLMVSHARFGEVGGCVFSVASRVPATVRTTERRSGEARLGDGEWI